MIHNVVNVTCPICGGAHYSSTCTARTAVAYATAAEAVTDTGITTTVTLYSHDGELLRRAAVPSSARDDRAVQAVAERVLRGRGLEPTSPWQVTPDPAATAGLRRLVWIADVGQTGGPIPCQRPGADPEDWFPVLSTDGIATDAAIRRLETTAAALCAGCPRREACLAEGLTEDYGVWGGEAPHQRRARRQRHQMAVAA